MSHDTDKATVGEGSYFVDRRSRVKDVAAVAAVAALVVAGPVIALELSHHPVLRFVAAIVVAAVGLVIVERVSREG